MTNVVPGLRADHVVVRGVYAPQHDSHLLIDALSGCVPLTERSVADVCTGSGVVGIAAARLGADRVSAWDISESAVQCARANAYAAGVVVDVRRGSLDRALARGPYDIVVSNPPYVPTPKANLASPSRTRPGRRGRTTPARTAGGCSIRCATRRRICSHPAGPS